MNRPTLPIRFAKCQLLLAIVVAMLVLALAACGGDESAPAEKTFDDDRFPFTFTYPGELEASDDINNLTAGDPGDRTRTSLLLDEDNAMVVTRYPPLNGAVTSARLSEVLPALDGVVSESAGKPVSGSPVEVGGYPAVRYDGIEIQEPAFGQTRVVFLFDDEIEYSIHCQSTPDLRRQVIAACDQAMATLRRR